MKGCTLIENIELYITKVLLVNITNLDNTMIEDIKHTLLLHLNNNNYHSGQDKCQI